MDELTRYQPPMPATIKRQMDSRLSNIHQIAAATKSAMDVQAAIYRHGWFTLLSEANQARFFLQAFQNSGAGDAELAFQDWFKDLETFNNRLYEIMGNKLVNLLESIPTESQPIGFWEEVKNQLYLTVFGTNDPPESPVGAMNRLEAQAKKALTDTARAHVSKLPTYLQRAGVKTGEKS